MKEMAGYLLYYRDHGILSGKNELSVTFKCLRREGNYQDSDVLNRYLCLTGPTVNICLILLF